MELAEEYKGTKWELSGHLALLISPIGLLQTRGIRHLSLHRGVLLQVGHLRITLRELDLQSTQRLVTI